MCAVVSLQVRAQLLVHAAPALLIGVAHLLRVVQQRAELRKLPLEGGRCSEEGVDVSV